MGKVKIYAIVEATCYDEDNDIYWDAKVDSIGIVIEDLLRPASQFNSFEDLIGRTIEHVEYDGDTIILTVN